jgi:hypothetical protein
MEANKGRLGSRIFEVARRTKVGEQVAAFMLAASIFVVIDIGAYHTVVLGEREKAQVNQPSETNGGADMNEGGDYMHNPLEETVVHAGAIVGGNTVGFFFLSRLVRRRDEANGLTNNTTVPSSGRQESIQPAS